jgi:AraC-like DNA-binding protein
MEDRPPQPEPWLFTRREPHPALRPFVRPYVGYDDPTPGTTVRMEAPGLIVPLIFNLGSTLKVIDPVDRAATSHHQRAFVAGMSDRHVFTESHWPARGVQVDFTPIGARLLLGRPMHELTNRAIDIREAFGADGEQLYEQLHEASGWDARFDLIERLVLRRFAAARRPAEGIAWAWQRLESTGGAASIGELAAALGCSRKHLAAQFRDQVGITPKTAARVIRFRRAMRLAGASTGAVRWSDVALRAGYFDQAHFNRDVRAFTGGTPGEYLQQRG